MAEIRFFHNAGDKFSAASHIIAAAYKKGRSVTIFAPRAEDAAHIDGLLWNTPAHPFLPHVAAASPLAAETPVVIDPTLETPAHTDVLVNLAFDPPPGFERFAQVIEIVTQDASDKNAARLRWQHYRKLGFKLESNDLARTEPP